MDGLYMELNVGVFCMASGRRKIAVIGAGNVGATCAFVLAQMKVADIVLLDIFEGFAKGKALDMSQNSNVLNYDGTITGTADYNDIAGSDVVVVTSGFPRKPGMSREDLIGKNAEIISQVGAGIRDHAPDSTVIMVTNPLDLMTYHMQKVTGFPTNRVIGQAGVLDSARLKYFLSKEFNVSINDISAFVLGGHGDTMVPLMRYSTVSGIPVPELIKMKWTTKKNIDKIIQRTRDGGAEIVKLMNTSAFYAPASSAIQMAESFLLDQKRLLPCAAYLNGEYGVKGLYVGVPVIIGKKGVEKIIELKLNNNEKKEFNHSVKAVKSLTTLSNKLLNKKNKK